MIQTASPRRTQRYEDRVPTGSLAARIADDVLGSGPYSWKHAYVRGLLSGYPLCCIEFFCGEWEPYGEKNGWDKAYKRWPQPHGMGYVECPAHAQN